MPRLIKVARFIQGIGQTQGQGGSVPRGVGANRPSDSPRFDHHDTCTQADSLRKHEVFKIGRYGLPFDPICVAVDPIQRLFAIGTRNGSIRICGKPGAEYHMRHESDAAVLQIVFLINEGGLVCSCSDGNLHMWNLRTTQPELTHSLRFNREGLSYLCIPYGTKWLYVGTDRGNIYVVNIESFTISGYEIKWNHVIDVSQRQAPGPVLKMEANPEDPSKFLLTYEFAAVLWDLKAKAVISSYKPPHEHQRLTCTSWSKDGSRFISTYNDGSCCVWSQKNNKKPDETYTPHACAGKNENSLYCCRINKVEWLSEKPSDMFIFSGGMPPGNKRKGLTLLKARSRSILLTDIVVDFCTLFATSSTQDQQEPVTVVVLSKEECVLFDLTSTCGPSIPWFKLPYTFNIHDSPVTFMQFYPDCPPNLLSTLFRAEATRKKKNSPAGLSKQKWPFFGGNTGEFCRSSMASLIITGHADGTVKFWDAVSNSLCPICKVQVSKLLSREVNRSLSSASAGSKNSLTSDLQEDTIAVQHIALCCESRTLVVACASNFVVVYKHYDKENIKELVRIEANFSIETAQEPSDSPVDVSPTRSEGCTSSPESPRKLGKSISITAIPAFPVVKTAAQRFRAGFQPEVFCQQICSETSPFITCVALSSAFGVVAYGNALGIALIDYIQKSCIRVFMNYELGVLGDLTDGTQPKFGLQHRSSGLSASSLHSNGSSDTGPNTSSKDSDKGKETRKGKSIKIGSSDHGKLTKRISFNNTATNSPAKDKEDGVFSFMKDKEIPIAGTICALQFSYSYTRKGAIVICPSLWIGTGTGSVTVVALSIPPNGEERKRQPVLPHNTGLQVDMLSGITSVHLLDSKAMLCPSPFELENTGAISTPTCTTDCNEKHFLVIGSEKRIKVKCLPSLKTYAEELPVSESEFIIKTAIVNCEDIFCLSCLTSEGHVLLYNLPRLSLVKDIDCGIKLNDYRLIRTFTFGLEGEAVYLSSPSEIQRIAFEERKSLQYRDSLGSPFCIIQAPEPPTKGFFQSLFSPAPYSLDREKLFGTDAGTASRSVASYTAGVGGAVMRAQQQLHQRQENLEKLDERVQEMRFKSENFADLSHQLAEKMANRKWWQL